MKSCPIIILLLVSAVTYSVVTGRIVEDQKNEPDFQNSVGGNDDLVPTDDEVDWFVGFVDYLRNGRSKRGIADYASMGAGMVENKHYLTQGVQKGVGYFKGRSGSTNAPGEVTSGSRMIPKAGHLLVLSLISRVAFYGFLKY